MYKIKKEFIKGYGNNSIKMTFLNGEIIGHYFEGIKISIKVRISRKQFYGMFLRIKYNTRK